MSSQFGSLSTLILLVAYHYAVFDRAHHLWISEGETKLSQEQLDSMEHMASNPQHHPCMTALSGHISELNQELVNVEFRLQHGLLQRKHILADIETAKKLYNRHYADTS